MSALSSGFVAASVNLLA